MKGLKLIYIGLLIAGIAIALAQKKGISSARAENTALRQESEEAARLARENAEAAKPGGESQEAAALMEANKELPKLRNEVRQLRQQKPEIERLRAENARLANAIKSSTNIARPRLAEMEGYVAREQYSRAGFATPEATMQTFFWAVANKDITALAECVTGQARKSMEQEIQKAAAGGKSFEEQFEPLAKLKGFRVAEKKQLSEDKVELRIQAAAGGQAMPMVLQLENGEWKLSN